MAQQAQERWNDMRARCNFLGVPQRILASGWELSQIVNALSLSPSHTHTPTQPDFYFALFFFFFFYCGSNWLQQQPQMLVGRNGANKTNLIANKLPGEFS